MAVSSRRIVLAYEVGPLAGLRQIVGTEDQLSGELPPNPQAISVQFLDHTGVCQLDGVFKTWMRFREVVESTPEVWDAVTPY